MSAAYPPPDATREEVEAWQLEHDPRWQEPCAWCDHPRREHLPRRCKHEKCACDAFTDHEAPMPTNGPAIVCNACTKIRIPVGAIFCPRCCDAMGLPYEVDEP